MKILIHPLLIFVLATTGCTSTQLRRSTLAQGRMLTDFAYQMVLDNVAMFREAPNSLPWHIKITNGTIAINDTLNPSFSYTWPVISQTLGFSPSRVWQQGWTVVPVVDPKTLKALMKIYTNAAKQGWIEEGIAPLGNLSGHYGQRTAWVSRQNLGKLTELTLDVLANTEVTREERGILAPGPVPSIK